MFKSLLAAVFIAANFTMPLSAGEAAPKLKVGDLVVINMTGCLAEKYVKLVGDDRIKGDGLQVSLAAQVTRIRGNGQIRVENVMTHRNDGQPDRMVTVAVTCDSKRIIGQRVPEGTAVFASPAAASDPAKAKLTTEDSQTWEVEVSNLKEIKIRSWTLTGEIGE